MNKHIQTMKNSLTNYQAAVKAGMAKMAENKRIYKPDIAEKENENILKQLREDLSTVQGYISEAQNAGRHDVDAWGSPDPAKITADAALLEHDAVNPNQFRDLVKKYENNSTMLQLLANYAEKKNQGTGGFEAVWNYGGKGNAARTSNHYDTTGLPTAEAKKAVVDNYAAKAFSLAKQIAYPIFNPTERNNIGMGPDSTLVTAALEHFGEDA